MVDRFSNERQFIDWNEDMARRFDPEAFHLRSNIIIRWIERRRVQEIIKSLHATQEDNILEVGCGAGNVLEQIPGAMLYGVDISALMLEKSKNRLSIRRAHLLRANVEALPLLSNQFSRLFCTEVLEHVINPDKVIREMARVATSNAIIVVSIPNENIINQIKRVIHKLGLWKLIMRGDAEDSYTSPKTMDDEWHLHSFDLPKFVEISKGKISIEKIQAIPFSFLPIRYVIKCKVYRELDSDF